MKMYEYVIVPPSVYRKAGPGIYIGKRPRPGSGDEMVLMQDKTNPTTFVLRILKKSEFEKVTDTGFNAEAQIKDIDTWFKKVMKLYEERSQNERGNGLFDQAAEGDE